MRWLFDLITVLGFILTALGAYLTCNADTSVEVMKQTLLIAFVSLALFTTVGWYHYYYKSKILKSVLKGRDHINGTTNRLIELNHNPKIKVHVKHGIQDLSEICQEISAGLRKYHAPDISVCIHYVNKDENGYYVNVLCRNTESKQRQSKRAPFASNKDYINDNTDFKLLIPLLSAKHINKIYYLNNFLPFSPYYRNSHFSVEMQPRYYGTFGWIYRMIMWELPYKSTLVVPLVSVQDKKRQIEGFLSIDSPKLWSFSKSYDLPMVLHLAGMIAPLVSKYNQSNLLK